MSNTWLIGAGINLVGSVMINLGTNVMKLGHNKRAAMEMRNVAKLPIRVFREWQIGVVLFIIGNLANFVSFGFAAQSLLAALGSVQFVSNVAFASIVLKEKVTLSILSATGCIFSGCVMLVLFGSHSSKQFTVNEMMNLYTNPAYIIYLICLCSFVVFMYVTYKYGKRKMLSVGFAELSHYWYRLLPISYALFSGMVGTQSVLFGKTISTLLRVTIGGNGQLGSWFTWVIIVLFLLASTFWVTRLNKALKFFPAMIIVPTMQISWTFFSILSGMLYFQEYKDFNLQKGIMFSFAVSVVFFGVFLLTRMKSAEHGSSTRLNDSKTDDVDRSTRPMIQLPEQEQDHDLSIRISAAKMWDNSNETEDIKTPIVTTPASDVYPSSDPKMHNFEKIESKSATTKTDTPHSPILVKQDNKNGPDTHHNNNQAYPKCTEESILDDLSLDVYSTLRGAVGLGPECVPGVTLFGPPGVVWLDSVSADSYTENCCNAANLSNIVP